MVVAVATCIVVAAIMVRVAIHAVVVPTHDTIDIGLHPMCDFRGARWRGR
jgi:hypothetical protein